MKLIFLNSFKKDLSKTINAKLKEQIISLIEDLEKAENSNDISNLKKLKGYPNAYRIRIGVYRLGIYTENNQVEIVRLVKRNDIYKVFP